MNARRMLTGALLALAALAAGGCHNGVYPNASFTIVPQVALAGEKTTLDASATTPGVGDDRKPVPVVKYRFDLNGDGVPELESRKPRVAVSLPPGNHCSTYGADGRAPGPTGPNCHLTVVRMTAVDRDGGESHETWSSVEVRQPVAARGHAPVARLFAYTEDPTAPGGRRNGAGTPGHAVTFDASKSSSVGKPLRFDWDFNHDGTFEASTTGPRFTHVFSATGTFTTRMRVVDRAGRHSNTVGVPVVISAPQSGGNGGDGGNTGGTTNQPPHATFTVSHTQPEENQPVSFDPSGSSDPDGHIVSYQFDYDGNGTFDATESTPAVLTHGYSTPGTYTARLRVTDDGGASNDYTQVVTVHQAQVVTRFTAGITGEPRAMTRGPNGDLWFTEDYSTGDPAGIGRITAGGQVTEYGHAGGTLLGTLQGITGGPDGNVWFTMSPHGGPETGAAVGRITDAGTITLFPLPDGDEPSEIVTGPGGKLWFGVAHPGGSSAIRSIATDGTLGPAITTGITQPPDDLTNLGGDVWWTGGSGSTALLGHTDGSTADEHQLSSSAGGSPESYDFTDLKAGPDGRLWFTAQSPAGVGRVTPSTAPGTLATTFHAESIGADTASLPFGIVPGPGSAELVYLLSNDQAAANGFGDIDLTGTSPSYSALTGFDFSEWDLAIGADGNVWVTNPTEHAVTRVRSSIFLNASGSIQARAARKKHRRRHHASVPRRGKFAGTITAKGSLVEKLYSLLVTGAAKNVDVRGVIHAGVTPKHPGTKSLAKALPGVDGPFAGVFGGTAQHFGGTLAVRQSGKRAWACLRLDIRRGSHGYGGTFKTIAVSSRRVPAARGSFAVSISPTSVGLDGTTAPIAAPKHGPAACRKLGKVASRLKP